MGGFCAKCDCSGCFGKKNRVAPLAGLSNASPLSINRHRTNADIYQELKTLGIVGQVRPGGASFELDEEDQDNRRPRTLPPLDITLRVRKSRQDYRFVIIDRTVRADLRRREILEEKGKMGRDHAERRRNVLARREEIIFKKIKKTEAKLCVSKK